MPYKDPEKQRECARRHYAANKDAYKKRAIAHKRKTRKLVREFLDELKSQPCEDCGKFYPPYVMDLDHNGRQKTANVADMANGSSCLARVKKEAKKCDVVCANCHRIRTHCRGMV